MHDCSRFRRALDRETLFWLLANKVIIEMKEAKSCEEEVLGLWPLIFVPSGQDADIDRRRLQGDHCWPELDVPINMKIE